MLDRVCNYIIGFTELGMSLQPIEAEFGVEMFQQAQKELILRLTRRGNYIIKDK